MSKSKNELLIGKKEGFILIKLKKNIKRKRKKKFKFKLIY